MKNINYTLALNALVAGHKAKSIWTVRRCERLIRANYPSLPFSKHIVQVLFDALCNSSMFVRMDSSVEHGDIEFTDCYTYSDLPRAAVKEIEQGLPVYYSNNEAKAIIKTIAPKLTSLLKEGYDILADDVCAFDSTATFFPIVESEELVYENLCLCDVYEQQEAARRSDSLTGIFQFLSTFKLGDIIVDDNGDSNFIFRYVNFGSHPVRPIDLKYIDFNLKRVNKPNYFQQTGAKTLKQPPSSITESSALIDSDDDVEQLETEQQEQNEKPVILTLPSIEQLEANVINFYKTYDPVANLFNIMAQTLPLCNKISIDRAEYVELLRYCAALAETNVGRDSVEHFVDDMFKELHSNNLGRLDTNAENFIFCNYIEIVDDGVKTHALTASKIQKIFINYVENNEKKPMPTTLSVPTYDELQENVLAADLLPNLLRDYMRNSTSIDLTYLRKAIQSRLTSYKPKRTAKRIVREAVAQAIEFKIAKIDETYDNVLVLTKYYAQDCTVCQLTQAALAKMIDAKSVKSNGNAVKKQTTAIANRDLLPSLSGAVDQCLAVFEAEIAQKLSLIPLTGDKIRHLHSTYNAQLLANVPLSDAEMAAITIRQFLIGEFLNKYDETVHRAKRRV